MPTYLSTIFYVLLSKILVLILLFTWTQLVIGAPLSTATASKNRLRNNAALNFTVCICHYQNAFPICHLKVGITRILFDMVDNITCTVNDVNQEFLTGDYSAVSYRLRL